MKKILLIISVLLLTGCSLQSDNLNGSTIYVTNYPIKYLVETLYKSTETDETYGTIKSIYPNDVDTSKYELTDKLIKEYSQAGMFVYNGLSNEKNIAKKFINNNRNILIMDVSYGLSTKNAIEELWLSPNNYLMLAKNVKDTFKDYLTNKTIISDVETNYANFAETMSLLDADLRSIGNQAKTNNTNTIVVTKSTYKFLESYGFIIVNLEDPGYQTEDGQKTIKHNFDNGKYRTLITDVNDESELVKSLVENNKAKKIELNTMTVGITDDNYIETMQEFINNLQASTN